MKLLNNRIEKIFILTSQNEQAGEQTCNNIHVLNQIIETSNEYQINLFLAFIDYEKAFDSLYHNEILSTLITQGINPQYVQLIEAVYKNPQARIILDQSGPFFHIKRGVKQGDSLSPILFNCTLEEVFRKLDW